MGNTHSSSSSSSNNKKNSSNISTLVAEKGENNDEMNENSKKKKNKSNSNSNIRHDGSIEPVEMKVEHEVPLQQLHAIERSLRTFAPPKPPRGAGSAAAETTNGVVHITGAFADVRDKYHVNSQELGHGHYGVVRKCRNRQTQAWYAIKSIRKAKIKHIEVLQREISILREVTHPHIIALVDVFEDTKYLHLVTEVCTGGELFDRIIAKSQSSEGHYSEHDAASLIRDILDAIAYCHAKGIVHRDLKPENFLFLTKSEEAPIKIIDFGLSRHKDNDDDIMKTKVGTPYYVAPEVLRREYTEACDVWSIGVITYILLCGYPPFYGDNDAEIFNSVKIGEFDFPSPEWNDISKSAKQFVTALLQVDPCKRPTARQAMQQPWITKHAPTTLVQCPCQALDTKDRTKILSSQSIRGTTFQKYYALQKLKKKALLTIAKHLSHDEVGSLEDIFRQVDEADEGVMSLTEIHDAILREKLPPEIQAELVAMKEDLSLSDDDTLNWKAFLAATIDKNLVMREDKIRFAFDHFLHSENKDYLTLTDFESIFDGDSQGVEVFKFLDTDVDGKVSFDDFRAAMEEYIDVVDGD